MEQELWKLADEWNPEARDTLSKQPTMIHDETTGQEKVEMVHYYFKQIYLCRMTIRDKLDYHVPHDIQDTLGKEAK